MSSNSDNNVSVINNNSPMSILSNDTMTFINDITMSFINDTTMSLINNTMSLINDSTMSPINDNAMSLINNDTHTTPYIDIDVTAAILNNSTSTAANSTNTTNNDTGESTAPASVMAVLLRFGIAFLILTVNTLTIVTFCRVRALRTLSNMLTVSLAVTDLMVGLIVFVSALNLLPTLNAQITSNAYSCVVRICWFFVCCSVSMMTICVTAWERYLFIVHPYKHVDYVNTRVIGCLIALTWLAGLAFGLTPALRYRWDISIRCDMYFVFGPNNVVYGSVGIFLATSISTLVFYSLIGRLVLEKRRSLVFPQVQMLDPSSASSASASAQDSDCRHASLRSKLLALKSPAVVFGAFFLSWAPHMLAYVLHDAGFHVSRPTRVWITNVGLCNSAMNFFVYLALNRQFRQALSARCRYCPRCPVLGREPKTGAGCFVTGLSEAQSGRQDDTEPAVDNTHSGTPRDARDRSALDSEKTRGELQRRMSVAANTASNPYIVPVSTSLFATASAAAEADNAYTAPTSTHNTAKQTRSPMNRSAERHTVHGVPSSMYLKGRVNRVCNTGPCPDVIHMISSAVPGRNSEGRDDKYRCYPLLACAEEREGIQKKENRLG